MNASEFSPQGNNNEINSDLNDDPEATVPNIPIITAESELPVGTALEPTIWEWERPEGDSAEEQARVDEGHRLFVEAKARIDEDYQFLGKVGKRGAVALASAGLVVAGVAVVVGATGTKYVPYLRPDRPPISPEEVSPTAPLDATQELRTPIADPTSLGPNLPLRPGDIPPLAPLSPENLTILPSSESPLPPPDQLPTVPEEEEAPTSASVTTSDDPPPPDTSTPTELPPPSEPEPSPPESEVPPPDPEVPAG